MKYGDYISKYDIDNLKIEQIVIKREIKEKRYVTNYKIAKEYPKTFVIYSKKLLDWKLLIEEKHYKKYRKLFVELYYENKFCEKSTY